MADRANVLEELEQIERLDGDEVQDNRQYCLDDVRTQIDEVLSSPSVRSFAKDIIRQGLTLDRVDAVEDAHLALKVLELVADG